MNRQRSWNHNEQQAFSKRWIDFVQIDLIPTSLKSFWLKEKQGQIVDDIYSDRKENIDLTKCQLSKSFWPLFDRSKV